MPRSIRPPVGWSTPAMRRISVDLPAPLRPRMPMASPLRTRASTPRSTSRSPRPGMR